MLTIKVTQICKTICADSMFYLKARKIALMKRVKVPPILNYNQVIVYIIFHSPYNTGSLFMIILFWQYLSFL